MNKLKELIELIGEKKKIESEINDLRIKLTPISDKLDYLNEKIKFSKNLHNFLCKKILETYTENELEEVGKYRKQLHPNPLIPTETLYVSSKIFDPLNDNWKILDYETEGNERIRFLISSDKPIGSISGIMTFLDTHYTDWIKINELEQFNENL